MTALEELPPDQRAVLELVLKRGRSYDEIARLLRIDRAGVRQRALAAFDALGPRTSVGPERRALITDYLLGALPPRVSEDVRARLAREWAARAWARVIASELATVASEPLPEIPVWHEDLELDGELPQSGGAERYATDTGEMPVAVVEPPDTGGAPRDD